MTIKIAPSLLSSDMANFEKAIQSVADHADYIHCDVMDGHFVPNLTFGAPVVKAIKRVSSLPLDVHLMIENPDRWIKDYLDAGLDNNDFLTFHIEACENPAHTINTIRSAGVRPGLAIKPDTSLESASEFIQSVDQLLIMTVEPGFGGQPFRHDMLDKIKISRLAGGENKVIAVDGGIDKNTAPLVVAAGADLLVAGSSIYARKDGTPPPDAIRELRMALS